jgi:hypothetical protein
MIKSNESGPSYGRHTLSFDGLFFTVRAGDGPLSPNIEAVSGIGIGVPFFAFLR